MSEFSEPAENWLPLPEFEDSYLISDWARIWSIERWVPNTTSSLRRVGGQFLVTPLNSHGYPVVRPMRGRTGRKVSLHILVALAFHGPRPPGHQVRHLNGIKTDCRAVNLAYGTPAENAQDTLRHGHHHLVNRERCPLDHLLVAPNLVKCRLPHRTCLACSRGRAVLQRARNRKGVELPLRPAADRKYAEIMGAAGLEVDLATTL